MSDSFKHSIVKSAVRTAMVRTLLPHRRSGFWNIMFEILVHIYIEWFIDTLFTKRNDKSDKSDKIKGGKSFKWLPCLFLILAFNSVGCSSIIEAAQDSLRTPRIYTDKRSVSMAIVTELPAYIDQGDSPWGPRRYLYKVSTGKFLTSALIKQCKRYGLQLVGNTTQSDLTVYPKIIQKPSVSINAMNGIVEATVYCHAAILDRNGVQINTLSATGFGRSTRTFIYFPIVSELGGFALGTAFQALTMWEYMVFFVNNGANEAVAEASENAARRLLSQMSYEGWEQAGHRLAYTSHNSLQIIPDPIPKKELRYDTPSNSSTQASQKKDVSVPAQTRNVISCKALPVPFLPSNTINSTPYPIASISGDAEKLWRQGISYHLGRGVPQDDALAFTCFQKSAELGNAEGQWRLGCFYATGNGKIKDESMAVSLFRKAAEQGHDRAQLSLGDMYDTGRGVEKNPVIAIEWYRKAEANGNQEAKKRLDER